MFFTHVRLKISSASMDCPFIFMQTTSNSIPLSLRTKRRWLRQRDASVEMCVSDIHTWMAINKLKLNTDKTELLYFHTKFCPYIQLNPMQRGSDVIHPSSHAEILVLSLTQQ